MTLRNGKTVPPSEAERQLLSPDQHRLLAILLQVVQDTETQAWVVRRNDCEESLRSELLLFIPQSLLGGRRGVAALDDSADLVESRDMNTRARQKPKVAFLPA